MSIIVKLNATLHVHYFIMVKRHQCQKKRKKKTRTKYVRSIYKQYFNLRNRKETGLEKFIPGSLAGTMKRKELRKLLSHFIKLNSNLVGSSSSSDGSDAQQQQPAKHLTALQAKLHYLRIIADLPSYGAKCFSTNISVSLNNF